MKTINKLLSVSLLLVAAQSFAGIKIQVNEDVVVYSDSKRVSGSDLKKVVMSHLGSSIGDSKRALFLKNLKLFLTRELEIEDDFVFGIDCGEITLYAFSSVLFITQKHEEIPHNQYLKFFKNNSIEAIKNAKIGTENKYQKVVENLISKKEELESQLGELNKQLEDIKTDHKSEVSGLKPNLRIKKVIFNLK
jgi:uncharacterized protein YeeX (DUF496 family)